jgi:hypothetical protein
VGSAGTPIWTAFVLEMGSPSSTSGSKGSVVPAPIYGLLVLFERKIAPKEGNKKNKKQKKKIHKLTTLFDSLGHFINPLDKNHFSQDNVLGAMVEW